MLKSMTGYGRKEMIIGGKKIMVEIKSVNHRFADYSIKIPRYYGFLEDRIRQAVSKIVTRGKIDVFVSVESYDEADKDIILNEELTRNYLDALYTLRDKFGLKDDISVMSVARNSELFKTERREEDEEEIWSLVNSVLVPATEDFTAMRCREGERIEKDLKERIAYMETLAKQVDELSPKTVEAYKQKLYAKITELLGDRNIDETRILTEVAIFADKVAVNEETVRLGSHFAEFYEILSARAPAGRRLDFLIQEMNREVNTIGSKASDVEIAKIVVTLKGEIEKLREQIQNIE